MSGITHGLTVGFTVTAAVDRSMVQICREKLESLPIEQYICPSAGLSARAVKLTVVEPTFVGPMTTCAPLAGLMVNSFWKPVPIRPVRAQRR